MEDSVLGCSPWQFDCVKGLLYIKVFFNKCPQQKTKTQNQKWRIAYFVSKKDFLRSSIKSFKHTIKTILHNAEKETDKTVTLVQSVTHAEWLIKIFWFTFPVDVFFEANINSFPQN